MAVYAVDKPLQQSQNFSRTTLGFGTSTATSKPVPSSSQSMSAVAPSGVDEGVLRPDSIKGTLRIRKGCLKGIQAIEKAIMAEAYSTTFGLKVERNGEEEMNLVESDAAAGQRGKIETFQSTTSPSNLKKSKSPSRPFYTSTEESSMSPSPARRRIKASTYRTEEEEGDDLDTLHLLENLLPPVPTSLLHLSSLKDSQFSAGSSVSSRKGSSSLSSSSYFPIQNTSSIQKKLEGQLDASALHQLRAQHDIAKGEVHQLLKSKRKALLEMQEKIFSDALRLLGRRSRSSSKEETHRISQSDVQSQAADSNSVAVEAGQRSMIGESFSPRFERKKPLFPSSSDMGKSLSHDEGIYSSTPSTSGVASVAMPGRSGTLFSSSGPSTSMGSYLSASFAMRGRDPPPMKVSPKETSADDLEALEDEEELYAQKRRLRERYPHADHSALPSAVNSDDESNVEVKKIVKSEEEGRKEEAEEEEQRGRGRGRAATRNPNPEAANFSKVAKADVESSIKSSSPSDRGRESRMSLDHLSKSQNVKKGALKTSTPSKGEAPSSEKKVAFAEAPKILERRSRHIEEPKEAVDESSDAVFEIDEELDDDETRGNSDITINDRALAFEGGRDELQAAETEEEEVPLQGPNEPTENIAQSLPTVGSFSAAMANSERQRRDSQVVEDADFDVEREILHDKEGSEGFDPASLRFEDNVISSVASDMPTTSPERTRGGSSGVARIRSVNDTSVYGSRPLGSRRQSQDPPDALLAGFPQTSKERVGSSTIGFRVAVGEAEARLSGLLAPYAPSHRSLWSSTSGKRKQHHEKYDLLEVKESNEEEKGAEKGKEKEKEEVENGWSAWQRRAHEASMKKKKEASDHGSFAKSVPIGITGIPSPQLRGIYVASALSTTSTTSNTTYYDKHSGFDLEPKTSLPYQEKKFTPSLRKASRHLTAAGASQSQRLSLPTIVDASETGASTADPMYGASPSKGRKDDKSRSGSVDFHPVTPRAGSFAYSIPGSVTRGFHSQSTPTTHPSSKAPTTTGFAVSETEKIRSAARSSVPYVQPPPPPTYGLRLEPDEKNRPNSIDLEVVKEESGFVKEEAGDDNEGSEGNRIENEVKFMHTLENLKLNKRTGWLHHRVDVPESIADHMYRMSILSMLLPNVGLDIGRCVQLCLVHDIAEALVGDLTPLDGVSKEEKLKREKEALLYLVHDLLGSSPAALRIKALWMEYEDRETLESKAVKDLDRFELALQAVEYEERHSIVDLQPFFVGSMGYISHPKVREWARCLARERESLWDQTAYKYHQVIPAQA
ncbi:hypothetical protein CBS101457_006599 [Exobasidium rhododendri]|nr:hypothetical protein CBS101457_006599 [Exobasidium rhododendri]